MGRVENAVMRNAEAWVHWGPTSEEKIVCHSKILLLIPWLNQTSVHFMNVYKKNKIVTASTANQVIEFQGKIQT